MASLAERIPSNSREKASGTLKLRRSEASRAPRTASSSRYVACWLSLASTPASPTRSGRSKVKVWSVRRGRASFFSSTSDHTPKSTAHGPPAAASLATLSASAEVRLAPSSSSGSVVVKPKGSPDGVRR